MPQTLLGLDIGSYSVKAALFETTFREFVLTDLFESAPLKADDLPAEDRSVVTTEAIIRLLEENKLQPSLVVTALPGMDVSSRILSLPLPAKQVLKVLPFELESQLPFGLDEIIVDHHLIASSKNMTTVLATAARREAIAAHLALTQGAKLDPAFVGLDSLSLYNLNLMNLSAEEGTYAIVDIGHQKSSICIVSNRQVRFVRTLLTAGRQITESVREKLDLTLDQALEVKHDHGILELDGQPLRSKDLRRLSSAIKRAIDPFIREMVQTFHAYQAQPTGTGVETPRVERIYLCGGSTLLKNLPEYISSITRSPVERLHFFPENHEVSKRLGLRQANLAQAVSIGLRAAARGANAKRTATVNYRKEEFAFARDMSDLRRKTIFFGKWAAAIFLVALLQVGLRYKNLSHQHRQIEKQVVRVFREIAPDVKKPPRSSTSALRILQGRINEYKEKQKVLTAGLNELTSLGLLREISKLLSPSIPIDTQELSIDRNKITIRAYTNSIASVDKIIEDLKKRKDFQNIAKGDVRDGPGGKKAFQLIITVGEEEKPKPRRSRRRR